ncbi:MAG TPA: type II toxin-antitoxin system VapC family toxin [Verrucomicrobiae bacterium]|nr:type II toxin-antitoxin system VapC family toxin [Verrucomicrobiae bacterium]
MNAYPDASFIFSLYVNRPHTALAASHVATMAEPIYATSLLRFEVTNAIRRAAFQRMITDQLAVTALAAFESDIDRGTVAIPAVAWEAVFQEAERLSHTHTPRTGLRGFDILHVATALTLNAREFLTFDTKQRALASAEGLKVRPA